MCKVGHSHSLTAHLVHCTTSHAPIGAYRSRFFACSCSFPYGNCVTHPVPMPISQAGIGSQRIAVVYVAAQILRGKQVRVCV
jgi:hypothetical protein